MDLIEYFFESSITFSVALFPVILSIFMYRFCKVNIKYIYFILMIYMVIPLYILYFTFSIDNLLYHLFSLLSSFTYLYCENLYLKITNKNNKSEQKIE